MNKNIPVVLFVYNRPTYLKQTLDCLCKDKVHLIYAFSDGPKTPDNSEDVIEVRKILHDVNWCDINIVERDINLGLGKSILTGVGDVFKKHDSLIVFEDDLVFVPGTYDYLCSALDHYKDNLKVGSVTGFTHPKLIPSNVVDMPYFDGIGESWSWGTWGRSWNGMENNALKLMKSCITKGIDVYKYGQFFPEMAEKETEKNIWAIRFIYLQMLKGELCMRPPYSLVEHIGFDDNSTNCSDGSILSNPPLQPCPPVPVKWPEPIENSECALLWKNFNYLLNRRKSLSEKIIYKLKSMTKLFI